jgi:hypothetical protein
MAVGRKKLIRSKFERRDGGRSWLTMIPIIPTRTMPRLQLSPPLLARLSVWPPRIAFNDMNPMAVAELQKEGTRAGQKLMYVRKKKKVSKGRRRTSKIRQLS